MQTNNQESLNQHFPGPKSIKRVELENGAILLIYSNMSTKSINLTGILDGGGVFDPIEKLGLSHFVSSMLLRGTERRSFNDIFDSLESVGANLSFSSSTMNTWFRGRALVKDFQLLLDLLLESLKYPNFPQDYVSRLRNQIITSLIIRDQDTSSRASMEFDKILFKDHPFGNPIDGYQETIANINREDLIQFHNQTYSPKNAIIAISGPLEVDEIIQRVQKSFDSWITKSILLEKPESIFKKPRKYIRKHITINGKKQTDISLGTFGPKRTDPDYYAAFLGNHILGQFGLYGRIGKSVRSEAGLAYYASSSLSAGRETGTWEFGAGVNPTNVEDAITLIKKEIKKFISKPVEKNEISDSKSHLIGRLPMSLESNAGITNALLSIERFNLGFDYLQNYSANINDIDAELILNIGKKYLDPEKLIAISAGDNNEN